MTRLFHWIGLAAVTLIALAILSPPVAAQLNRISPRQIVCTSGLLTGSAQGMVCSATPTIAGTFKAAVLSAGDGTFGAPGLSFTGQSTTGFYRAGSAALTLSLNGQRYMAWSGSNTMFAADSVLGWGATAGNSEAASDTTIARATTGELTYTTLVFANLGTPANGTLAFCTDCAPTTPVSCPGTKASCVCAGSGAGSLAVRVNATWYCPF